MLNHEIRYAATDQFAAYVHIPFCKVRCGYCDFNTYTNLDFGPGAAARAFDQTVIGEIDLSAEIIKAPLSTVFFGGGTPTMLHSGQLVNILNHLRQRFGISPGAEVTTEANPETVTEESLTELRAGGFTRVSFGMQSAVESVLRTLDRQHSPGQVTRAVQWARQIGLEHSVDLIYGAPGESLEQWRQSLETAISLDPPHISAYGLTIEEGTKMGAQLRRGQIAEPDPDELAAKYILADELLTASGYSAYEISNWAKPGHQCQHNLAYWKGANWWGYGPGAHSHINGTRFWNVKHPLAYANKISYGELPVAEWEHLNQIERREEDIMLGIRLAGGIKTPSATPGKVIAELIADGLIDPASAFKGRIVLTVRGRLLADTVTRALW